jgi:hypothetical protein
VGIPVSRSRWMRFVVRLLIFTLYVNDLAAFGPVVRSETPVEAAAIARKPQIALPRVNPPRAAMAASATAPAIAPTTAPTTETTLTSGGGSGIGLGSGASASVFGPKRYTRTTDAPNKFTESITTPDWVRWPYVVRIKNGESNGSNRVSSAVVLLNGLPVASPLDFNQHVDTVDRPVLLPILTHHLTLYVEVRGEPGSYITITLLGTSGDTRAPTITITDPSADTTTSNNTPHLAVTYADADASDCVASGLDTSTLRVTLDGVDRTSLFTVTNTGAEATIPTSLALSDGSHVMHAEIKDRAGNIGTADRSFNVRNASQPPTLTITAPAEGALVGASPLTVSGTVVGSGGGTINVQCRVGGTAVGATVSGTGWTCSVSLIEGDNAVVVTATDAGGSSQLTRQVALDSTAPTLTVVQPIDGQSISSNTVDVRGGVTDAHAVTVRVNGIDASITDTAFATTVPVGNGPTTTITVSATDLAGNSSQQTLTLQVDRTPPTVQITTPVADAYVQGSVITVTGTVQDASSVLVDVNGQLATVSGNTFTAAVPSVDGPLVLTASAQDRAGNRATAQISIIVDSVSPAITVSEPADGLVTRASSVHLAGTVSDTSPVTLRADAATVPVASGQFALDLPLTNEGPRTITLTAKDAAGNTQALDWHVVVDRTSPTLDIVSPSADAIVGQTPVSVQGIVHDQTATTVVVNGVEATRAQEGWHVDLPVTEGRQTLTAVAIDAAGNRTTVTRDVVVDLTAPTIAITAPAPGFLTRADAIDVLGTVADVTTPTVSVNGHPTNVRASSASSAFDFNATPVALAEGDNSLHVVATDAVGRSGEATVIVTRDSTPPTVDITAPDRLSMRHPGKAHIAASDNLRLAQVVVQLGDAVLGTFTNAPIDVDLPVPDGVSAGSSLALVAEATDAAGNRTTASQNVLVIAEGVLVGQVLSDTTGLPLAGAAVSYGTRTETTDERGAYSLPAADQNARLVISKDGWTSVTRTIPIQNGLGAPVIDARLTPLAPPVAIGADGGQATTTLPSLGQGEPSTVQVSVRAGAVGAPVGLQLTGLSPQGLPGLLPLGWSPVAAFDLRLDQSTAKLSGLSVRVDHVSTASVHLVQYRSAIQAWTLVMADLAPAQGVIDMTVPSFGTYALVIADTVQPPLAVPSVGQPLTGTAATPVPDTATSTGVVTPAVLPPAGGTALGMLAVQSPTPLASGTVVQTEVTETFTLATGQVASEEKRLQDLVLFQAPKPDDAAAAASFPITPSRTFAPADLTEGRVHLDIFAGRDNARGVAGGSDAVSVTAGGVRLTVGAGALTEDTAMGVEAAILSTFLPAASDLEPIAETVVDLSGKTLRTAAELSVATGLAPTGGETWLVARVERLAGVPVLAIVALADLADGRLVTRATPDLPGITRGGRYVFYRATAPIGFVVGTVSAQGQPLAAIVQIDGLPFVALADAQGRFTLVAREGHAALTGRVPGTSLTGSATVTVTAGQTLTQALDLIGSVSNATVTPGDGALRVPVSTQIEITTTVALNATSATTTGVRLLTQTDIVPVRLVLSGSGQTLAVIPVAPLQPATTYRLEVAGLIDIVGGAIVVPMVSFTTSPNEAPTYDTSKLVFGFPDMNRQVTITAPAGALPPGTKVLVVNQGNGIVVSLTADNTGAINGQIIASISDRLLVTLTDPQGGVVTFERSEFVAADGRTGIGPGGGVAHGANGLELRVPEGAVSQGVELTITPFDETRFASDPQPALPEAHFASGMQIDAPQRPTFTKEVHLAFEKPAAAPDGAFFYVYRRLQGPDGKLVYETLDHAYIEGDGANPKVVTASYPFAGYMNSIGSYNLLDSGGAVGYVATCYAILMWTFDAALPAKPTPGVITGKVRRTKWQPGAAVPDYEPIAGALVSGVDAGGQDLVESGTGATVAVSQTDGTFTLWDPQFTGGTVRVKAYTNGEARDATAYEFDQTQVPQGLRPYPHVGTVTVTFDPVQPPPPAPRLHVSILRDDNGQRQPSDGVVIAGTPLIIGVVDEQPNGQELIVQGFSINHESHGARPDPMKGQAGGLDYILDALYTPAQPGSYTVTVTAIPAFGASVSVSSTFRVIAEGGGVSDPLPTQNPAVIEARTAPKRDAHGVPVSMFPQVVFTEPVKHVPGHVSLVEADTNTPVPFVVLGVGPSGPISNVDNDELVVTALTLQPTVGLKFNTTYRLTLTPDIVDLDTGAEDGKPNKALDPYETTFTTFGPDSIGGTQETFTSAGMVALGQRGYVATPEVGGLSSHMLRVFDLSDPIQPQEISDAAQRYVGFPKDLVGEAESALTGGPVVAVGTLLPSPPWGPSNLYVFDAAQDKPRWIAAVSLGTEPIDGIVARLVLHGEWAYAATTRKGLQVVDLVTARQVFSAQTNDDLTSPGYWQMLGRLNLPGQGFGQEAIVQTIDVPHPDNTRNMFTDLAVGDYLIQGVSRRLLVATGRSPLAIADADTGSLLYNGPIPWLGHDPITAWSQRVTLAHVGDRDVAILLFWSATATLAVVDLTDPTQPQVLSTLALPADSFSGNGSLLFKDGVIYIGGDTSTTLVTLADPTQPRLAGAVADVSGQLAFSENGLLVGVKNIYSPTAGETGITTAALGPLGLVRDVTPFILATDDQGNTSEPMSVTYQLVAPPPDLTNARLTLRRDDQILTEVPLPTVADGTFNLEIPAAQPFQAPDEAIEIRVIQSDGTPSDPILTSLRNVREMDNVVNGAVVLPIFETLSQGSARAGSATDVSVTITGQNLSVLQRVALRATDGNWGTVTVSSRQDSNVTVKIPSALLATPGLLQIAPATEVRGSLPFVVSDPALPAVGTSPGVSVSSIDSPVSEAGTTLIPVIGTGFDDGSQVVLGRVGTTGVVVPTRAISDTLLQAEVDEDALGTATDLTVAVLASDGASMSNSVPLSGSQTLMRAAAAPMIAPPAIALTNVNGTLVWNGRNQEIELEGLGLLPGQEILFQKKGGAPLGRASARSSKRKPKTVSTDNITTVLVSPPDDVAHFPYYCMVLQASDTRGPFTLGTPQCVIPEMKAAVPMGGRLKFAAYRERGKENGPIHLLHAADPDAGPRAIACSPDRGKNRPVLAPSPVDPFRHLNLLNTDADAATFTISGNTTVPNPATVVNSNLTALAPIPLAEREGNRCDPDNLHVLYLRGIRPKDKDKNEHLTVSAIATQGPSQMAFADVNIVYPSLGAVARNTANTDDVNKQLESSILDAAAAFGVPPQFLKSQASYETGFDVNTYRYEPITIDYNSYGVETRKKPSATWDSIIKRHFFASQSSGALKQPEARSTTIPGGQGRRTFPLLAAGDAGRSIQSRAGVPRDAEGVISTAVGRGWIVKDGSRLEVRHPYRTELGLAQIAAVLIPASGPATQLSLIEDRNWRRGGGTGSTSTGLPDFATEITIPAAPGPGQFSVDYANATITLGDDLQATDRVDVFFQLVAFDTIPQAGECTTNFNPKDLRTPPAKVGKVTYEPGDTIGLLLERTIGDNPRGGPLTGTESERMIEFGWNANDGVPAKFTMDRRFGRATAQYLAAGSFGPLQATLYDWDDHDRELALRTILDLRPEANSQYKGCLQDLATANGVQRAFRLGALRHTVAASAPRPACVNGLCDQQDWMLWWTKVIESYNRDGDPYTTCAEKRKNGVCPRIKPDGINDIVRRGLGQFSAK